MIEYRKIFESIMEERCIKIHKMQGGVTNSCFSVVSPSGHYILRIPGKGTNEYINRQYEIKNMHKASKLGFIPSIVYADTKSGIIITEYIENSMSMGIDDVSNTKHLKLMSECLIRLHGSNINFENEFNILETRNHYARILKNMNTELPKKFLDNIPILLQATTYLSNKYKKELVPCHGDPKLNNFLLQNDTMWLVDWEYSGLSEKYFDLVNMVMTDRLNEKEERLFLESYEENSGEKLNMEKYILYKVSTDFLWIYWHLIKFFQGEMIEYNDASWKNRLNRAIDNIKKLERI